MGLLSSKTFRQIAIGAGTGILEGIQEARIKGEEGLANLKKAREEVTEEVANLKNTYESALTVGASVGGGAFANFIFNEYNNDIATIAALNQMTPENKNEALADLKKKFEDLPEEARDTYQDYTKFAKSKFAKDVNELKINKGLQTSNNMGSSTTNLLTRLMTQPPKDIREQQEEVVSGFRQPELDVTEPMEGGYKAIRPEVPKITVDQGDILSYLKNSIDTFSFEQKETKDLFERDYNTLVTGSPADKAKIIQKYYYPVYQTKVPIYPTGTVVSTPDAVEDWETYFQEDNT